jgi:hypothetical protein
MEQIDFTLIRIAADLAVNFFTTGWYVLACGCLFKHELRKSLHCQIVCNSQTIVRQCVMVTLNHRFLRGKIVDREPYDQWNEHNQGAEGASMQMVDVDVEIHPPSFHIQYDDQEKLHAQSTPNEGEEKDGTNLVMKTNA